MSVAWLPWLHIAKLSSPVCGIVLPSTSTCRCAPWMLTPSAHVPPPPVPSAAVGAHGPGFAQLPTTTMFLAVMFSQCPVPAGVSGIQKPFCTVPPAMVTSSTTESRTGAPPKVSQLAFFWFRQYGVAQPGVWKGEPEGVPLGQRGRDCVRRGIE